MTLQRFSLLTFPSDDVPAAVDFYRRALGWEPAEMLGDDMAAYQFNGFVFAFFGRSGWAAEELGIDPPAYSVAAINQPSVEEVDAVVVSWEASGGEVLKRPHHTYWGGYSGYVRDPDGNLIELAWNPGWPITADGRTLLGADA